MNNDDMTAIGQIIREEIKTLREEHGEADRRIHERLDTHQAEYHDAMLAIAKLTTEHEGKITAVADDLKTLHSRVWGMAVAAITGVVSFIWHLLKLDIGGNH